MYLITDQFIAGNKAVAEPLIGLAQIQFSGLQKLAALTFSASKTAIEDNVTHIPALLHARDMQELIDLGTTLGRRSLEKSITYSRGAYEIATQSQAEITKLAEAQAGESSKWLVKFIDALSKNAPARSEAATAALKSALAAASSAYDGLNKISKQATELAAANFSAATEGVKETKKKTT